MRTPASVTSLHDRFKCALTHRYFIRLHMTILVLLVLLAGLLASRGLTHAGVRNMGLRYPIAVLFSYLVFFVLVRIWIAYVCRASRSRQESASSSDSSTDMGNLFSGGSGGSGGSTSGAGKLVEGGGRFGGGGSSARFADAQASTLQAAAVPAPRSGGSRSSSSSGFSLDLDGDGLLLLILFVLLASAILGVGVYLVYQGPAILSEAAFQAVLASGLVKTARSSHDPGWMESVLKATVLPFLLVLALAGLFGYEAHKRCPQATTIRQVFRQCIFR